jgi:hypothetical protein
MKATDFEYRRQLLLHELIVGAALLTYLIDRDDVFWRFIKTDDLVLVLERCLFAVTTLLFGVSACLCTWARAYAGSEDAIRSTAGGDRGSLGSFYRLRLIGDFVYAIALATLLPLSGFFILTVCEATRLVRLAWRGNAMSRSKTARSDPSPGASIATLSERTAPATRPRPQWGPAFRRETVKWGLFVTMIVFTLTLKDRAAEVLIGASIVLWILLNLRLSAVRSYLRVCLADRHA